MQVVIEPFAEAAHHGIELGFAGMPERGMTDVVGQGQGFRQILAQAQDRSDRPGDLRYLDGVGEAIAEVIGKPGGEDLGLVFQPAERPGVNYAVAVAAKFIAVRVRQFGIAPAAGALHRKAQPRERTFLAIYL
jgi:hypothetical protein